MKIEICTLCEYASEHNGRITIVDTLDAIIALKLPWRAYFYFVTKIKLENKKKSYQNIKMRIVKENDEQEILFEANGSYDSNIDNEKMNLIAGFNGIVFNESGEYNFQVFFDEENIVNHTFNVVLKNEQ